MTMSIIMKTTSLPAAQLRPNGIRQKVRNTVKFSRVTARHRPPFAVGKVPREINSNVVVMQMEKKGRLAARNLSLTLAFSRLLLGEWHASAFASFKARAKAKKIKMLSFWNMQKTKKLFSVDKKLIFLLEDESFISIVTSSSFERHKKDVCVFCHETHSSHWNEHKNLTSCT